MKSGSQKSLAAFVVVLLVLGGFFVTSRRPALPSETEKLAKQSREIPPSNAIPPTNKRNIESELESLRRENQRLTETLDQISANAGDGPTAKVNRLRETLSRLPEQCIPEFQLLKEDDWYAAVEGRLESVDEYRAAMSKLRRRVESRFAYLVQPALRAFLNQNGKFPDSPIQLKSFADASIDEAMLLRYKVAPATEVPNVKMGGDWIITQVNRIDSDYDICIVIGPQGTGGFVRNSPTVALAPVVAAFRAANPGVPPNDPAQLLPYAKTPAEREEVERLSRSMPRR